MIQPWVDSIFCMVSNDRVRMYNLSMNKRIEAIVTGKVQVVLFRRFVKNAADGLELVGFAENLPDGTVRIVAEGEESLLKTLLAGSEKGPGLAEVKAVAVDWLESTGNFESFDIR